MQPLIGVEVPLSGSRLHVFDMDGTLLIGAATVVLAGHFGDLAAGNRIEAGWLAGTVTEQEFWQTLLDVCGEATAADLDAAFHGARWMSGIADTFADIRARGEAAIVISQSPAFFVQRLQYWGAHETYGSDVEIGRPLSEGATLSPEAKVEITKDALGRLGLTSAACVAYGDSSSDVDLFDWLEHTVAVNASPAITQMAAASYTGTDISEAYAIGRRLLRAKGADLS
ncbi:haloacid dehalogenase-like hydrolase [Gordonia sp. Z-3]|uniref:HAD family hydrolase n=1 Tax=Gordonia sp. Z-3 TaxID=3115408 RepID=UPI002E29FDBA|nr:haloacid dehalogenase-like hydrolase [Gordonia sp. Z-3]MED5804012.1 haloacid dehalogenase-like hydrolase [Gordonia sp. Z-3]